MHATTLKAICLSLFLLCIRVEGDKGNATSKDEEDKMVTLDDFNFGRELQSVEAVGSLPGPSRVGFEDAISRSVENCKRRRNLPRCSWRNGYIVTDTIRTFRQAVSDDVCCCACRKAAQCDAIHYDRREGSCAFHQGPTTRDRRERGVKRWVKQNYLFEDFLEQDLD